MREHQEALRSLTLPAPPGIRRKSVGYHIPRRQEWHDTERNLPADVHPIRSMGRPTMALTRDEIVSVLGPVDDATIAEIAATGATLTDLREAWGWLHGDEALMGEGRPLPGTQIASLIEILGPDEEW
jgi:hypothetical protein